MAKNIRWTQCFKKDFQSLPEDIKDRLMKQLQFLIVDFVLKISTFFFRVWKGFECHENKEEADEHGQGNQELHSIPCPDLVFKLAAPLNKVAVRQHDLLRHDL